VPSNYVFAAQKGDFFIDILLEVQHLLVTLPQAENCRPKTEFSKTRYLIVSNNNKLNNKW